MQVDQLSEAKWKKICIWYLGIKIAGDFNELLENNITPLLNTMHQPFANWQKLKMFPMLLSPQMWLFINQEEHLIKYKNLLGEIKKQE